jgi:hypothetical protein
MHRVLAATLTTIIAGGFAGAAYADDTSAPGSDTQSIAQATSAPVQPAKPAKPAKTHSSKQAAPAKAASTSQSTAVTVATRVSSMTVASVVGVPIGMVRRSKAESVIATKELVGDTKHKWLYVAAAPLGFLGGVVSGVFQGIVYSPYNAYKYSDQPFSKEQFSLGAEK